MKFEVCGPVVPLWCDGTNRWEVRDQLQHVFCSVAFSDRQVVDDPELHLEHKEYAKNKAERIAELLNKHGA